MVAIDKYDTDPCDEISVKDWQMDAATFSALRVCLAQARDASTLTLRHVELTLQMVQQLAVALADSECSIKHVVLDFNPLYEQAAGRAGSDTAHEQGDSAPQDTSASAAAGAPQEDAPGDSKHADEAAASLEQDSKGGEGGLHETPAPPQRQLLDPSRAAAAYALLLHPDITLKSLSLRGCGLWGAGSALAIAAALAQNETLETLVLSDNPLGDEGLSLLAHAVRDSPAPLHELDVSGAGAGAEGVLAVVAAAAPWALTEHEMEQRTSVLDAREVANTDWQAACEEHALPGAPSKGGKGGKSKAAPKSSDKKKGKGSSADGLPLMVPWFVRDLESLSAAHRSAVDVAVRSLVEHGEMPTPSPDSLPPSMQDGAASKSLKGGKGGKSAAKGAADTAVSDDTVGVKLWLTHAKSSIKGLNVSRNSLGIQGLRALRATLVPDQLLSLVSAHPPTARPSSAAGSDAGSYSKSPRSSSPKSGARRGSNSSRGVKASPRDATAAPPAGALAATSITGVQAVWAQDALGADNHLYSVFVPEGMQGGYLSASAVKAWWGVQQEQGAEGGASLEEVSGVMGSSDEASAKGKLLAQSALYTAEVKAELAAQAEQAERAGVTLLL